MATERIIQFGEGNFLRAFAEDFIHEMNKQGLYDGSVAIVKPTPRGDLGKFGAQGNVYHLLLRGIEDGKTTETIKEIRAVSRCVNPYADFKAYLALARQPAFRFIISNTTEAGIAFDETCRFEDTPALSFPGKLTQLLYERFRLGLPGFVLLPCELIDSNGDALKACVLRYAALWALGDCFVRWLEEENDFCNTLVDRIVSGYPAAEAAGICRSLGCEDLLLDTAEPYHFWAIEGNYEAELPLRAAGINALWTTDVSPYKKMKVRILNGQHTSMVFAGLLAGHETVADCMADPAFETYLGRLLKKEILPTLPDDPATADFAAATAERFKNPYLRHRLRSIALNSVAKYRARVVPTLLERTAAVGKTPRVFALSLAALLFYYKQTNGIEDETAAVERIKAAALPELLRDESLWGADLSTMEADVTACMRLIGTAGVREAMQWSIS